MDELELMISLAVIVLLLIIFIVPYLFFSHLGLKRRVREMDDLLRRLRNDLAQALEGQTLDKAPAPVTKTALISEAAVPDKVVLSPQPTTQPPMPGPQPWSRGPEQAAKVADAAKDNAQDVPPRAYVFKPDLIDNLTAWLRENWVLAIAAASLALAGVFMVQYGIENGLLTPFWRITGALGFGAALIAGGEYIRRKAGTDTEDGDAVGATKFLPSTLSGAGIIVLYVAVFAARALYGLIGPTTMLAGLTMVSGAALVLGWFYGPVLAAVGILGATLAPFITGSNSDNSWLVQYYLAMVAVVALGIDTIKRWAWVSALGLIATFGASAVLYAARGADLHFLAGTLFITLAAFAIPERGLIPRQSGPALLDAIISRGKVLPGFPARLTLGATLAATFAALWVQSGASTADTVWLALFALAALLLATLIWAREAPALYDHALIPGLGFLAALVLESGYGPLFREFENAAIPVIQGPENPIPMTIWVLAAMGGAGTLLMFARMGWAQGLTATFWAFCAATFAPATILILEFFWSPGAVLGQYPWALAVIAMAGLMTLLATRAATDDAGAPLRIGLFAVGALTLVTLAFFLVTTKSALTVALAVMVLGTAWLDRRHALPPLSVFIQIAVAIITFRLVIWPGFDWALRMNYEMDHYQVRYFEVAFAFLATLALLAAAWKLSQNQRPKTALVLESACWAILGVFLAVTLLRMAPREAEESHWVMGLMSTIWIALALNQLYRMRGGNRFMTVVRAAIAGVYGLTALVSLGVLLFASNPLKSYGELVVGPPILDSLALAFLPLAAVFAVAARKIPQYGRKVQIAFILASSFFATLYIGMEIRRLWRGPDLTVPGFSDAELYSYTLAMLIASVALLMFAFSRRSNTLRKVAMAGVALTIAKVFLVDTSGLSGLIRVMSFMGLGLSLVALTWLNRKMTAQWDRTPPDDEAGPTPSPSKSAPTAS